MVQAKLDCGYDDYLKGRISGDFWARRSVEWESELGAVDAELNRASQPTPPYTVTAARISELAKKAYRRCIPGRIWRNGEIHLIRCYRTARSIEELFVRLMLSRLTSWHEVEKLGIGGEGVRRTVS